MPSTSTRAVKRGIHAISETGLYFADDVQAIFRWRASTLRREIREHGLRHAKAGGRYVFLGRWLIEFIEQREVKRGQE